jgi:endonuclease YncB( thermonuclease family)
VYRLDSSTLPPAEASCVDKGESWDCGAAAWDIMDQYLDDPSIECRPLIAIQSTATDFIPVECYGSGKNLNAWLIRSGWALADQKENALFEEEETLAQEEQLGIWRGGFEPPSDWRRSPEDSCDVCTLRHQSLIKNRKKQTTLPTASSND